MNETIKCKNRANKEQREEMVTSPENKNATIKINLMIESVRQNAPIAKRISGDGAFCLFNSFIFGEIYLAECAIRRRDSADDL